MNLNLDFSAVPRALRGMLAELRQKKLWPVAILLLAGLVAVPVLLSKSSSRPAATAEVPSTPPPASGTTLPTLNVVTTPSRSTIYGSARNPFGAAAGSSTPGSTTTSSAATAASSVATSVATAPGGSGGGSSSTSTTSSTTSSSSAAPTTSSSATSSPSSGGNPPSIVPVAKPKPAPTGLTKTESYDVSLATTEASGGLNTADPLERLSVISTQSKPRLIELGVLQGGKRVLFALQPGTVVVGPGTCTPGPIDCEILSLGRGQTESVSAAGSSTTALLAVTSIRVAHHGTVAAANRARRATSATGRALLNASTSAALALFQYQPSLGVVVDLRNLSAGH